MLVNAVLSRGVRDEVEAGAKVVQSPKQSACGHDCYFQKSQTWPEYQPDRVPCTSLRYQLSNTLDPV